jgi:hypothetical protein
MFLFYMVMFVLPAFIILLAVWLARKDARGNE